jgi:hypothetical protein
MRIELDTVRGFVNLMLGNLCVDQMTITAYQELFGFKAASVLLRQTR